MTSLSRDARVAGLLYILASLLGVVRLMYIPNALFVHGNATATANNIVAHASLFRLGIVSSLLAAALWLFVPLALYRLLKGVDQTLAVLMVILGSLMQVPRLHPFEVLELDFSGFRTSASIGAARSWCVYLPLGIVTAVHCRSRSTLLEVFDVKEKRSL